MYKKPCAKSRCPTNIKNSRQRNDLMWIDRKTGNVMAKKMKRGNRNAKAKRRVIARRAVAVPKVCDLFYMKKTRAGKLVIVKTKAKQCR